MLQQNIQGSIILMASMSATICVRPQKQAAYNTSKGAVQMLAKSLATEWAPHGIRVNSLSPGYMATDLIKGLLNSEGKELVKNWEKDIPVGRMAEPHELRGTIVWMASKSNSGLCYYYCRNCRELYESQNDYSLLTAHQVQQARI